jgi:phage gp46-like protein
MACDLALAYDASRNRCDLVFNGRDFVLDPTLATPMLMAVLSRRRARPDDVVPDRSPGTALAPSSLTARGGWPGDALDPQGRLTGGWLWLLADAKATEQTRQQAEDNVAVGLEQVEADRNCTIALQVTWSPQRVAGGRNLIVQAAGGGVGVAVTQMVG